MRCGCSFCIVRWLISTSGKALLERAHAKHITAQHCMCWPKVRLHWECRCALADFYIRQGLFERARDIYQEGVEAVTTVRDFSMVFEALTKFEHALVEAQVDELDKAGEEAGAKLGYFSAV